MLCDVNQILLDNDLPEVMRHSEQQPNDT
jgi:hypothetical protein